MPKPTKPPFPGHPRAVAGLIRVGATTADPRKFFTGEIYRLQQEYMERVKPFGEALSIVTAGDPPAPITLPDGQIMVYRGLMPSQEQIKEQLLRLAQQIEDGTWKPILS